jgi:hypothetical protein
MRVKDVPRPLTGVARHLLQLRIRSECQRAGHQPVRVPSGTVCQACGESWRHD